MPLWVLPQLSSVMWRHAELPDSYAFSLTGTLCHHFLLVLQCTLGKAPLDCIKAIDTEQRSWEKKPLTEAPHPTAHFPHIPSPLHFCLRAQRCDMTSYIVQQMQRWKPARLAFTLAAVRGAEHDLAKRRQVYTFLLQFIVEFRRKINHSHSLVHTSGVINYI